MNDTEKNEGAGYIQGRTRKLTLFAVSIVVAVSLLVVEPDRNVSGLVRASLLLLVQIILCQYVFEVLSILLRDLVRLDLAVALLVCFGMARVDVSCPADEQLLVSLAEGGDTGDHGAVSVSRCELPSR